MRYTRLRRAIEGGTLIGTHGTPFQGAADKETGHQKRRRAPLLSVRNEGTTDLSPMHIRSGYSFERKTSLEEAPANGSVSDGTSEDDELTPVKKRNKLPSHIDILSKHEGCSSESYSPALSYKPTTESGTACAEEMDIRPTDHPSAKEVDRLLTKIASPKTDPGITPTPLNNVERKWSSEKPEPGDSSGDPVNGGHPQALCGADEKQFNDMAMEPSLKSRVFEKEAPIDWHNEVHRSVQSVKHEADKAGPTLKAEGSRAEQT